MPEIIYGLDIETDIRTDAADPAVAAVVRVALSGRRFDEVFEGPEADLFADLDDRLAGLAPGVIATWNGSTFDLPFIADRARLLGVDLGLRLCMDDRLTMQRALLPGHRSAYRAAWHQHTHVDTFRLYGRPAAAGPWSSLRNIGRVLGLSPAPTAASTARFEPLSTEAQHAHAASDARLARVLAERRWSAAHRLIDRVAPIEVQPIDVAMSRLERQARLDHVRVPAPV